MEQFAKAVDTSMDPILNLPTRLSDSSSSRYLVLSNENVHIGLTTRFVKKCEHSSENNKEVGQHSAFPLSAALFCKPVNDFLKAYYNEAYKVIDFNLHSLIQSNLAVFTNKEMPKEKETWNTPILSGLNEIFTSDCQLTREEFYYMVRF